MANFRITELDFDSIKDNLKIFLTNYRDKEGNLIFADYDFDASSLSILLDILAYNTHYNAYLSNMVANEMFLDSAVKRESVVSIAKHLGYTPLSYRSARAVVTFTVNSPSNNPSSLTLPKYTPFTTSIDGKNFTFVNLDAVTIVPTEGLYIFRDVEIVQGEPLSFSQRVDVGGPGEKYVIPNKNVDTASIRVTVQKSYSDLTTETYTLAENLSSLTALSKVFFIEENANGYFEVYFGDGVLGSKLEPRNLVQIQYLVSSGSVCNVSSDIEQTFSIGSDVGGGTVSGTIAASSNSTGGAEPDTTEEIKFKAPKFLSSFNRAVTAKDYKSIIEASYPLIESVAVWGGEDNDPPRYGKVIISLKPYAGYTINNTLKENILKNILLDKKMVSIVPEFVDPNFLYITIDSTVRYNAKNSRYNSIEIQELVNQTIRNYFSLELQKFDKDFIYSKLTREIDNIDSSIIGNKFSFKLQKRIQPIVNSLTGYTNDNAIKFNNSITTGSVYSTNFYYILNDAYILVCLRDELTTDAIGKINIVDYYQDIVLVNNIGNINYSTGILSIPNLTISGFEENSNDIRIYAKTTELDINASRDTILMIDDSQQNALVNRDSGLLIRVIEE